MGEYDNDEAAAIEASLFNVISSCNIACGGHAGDDQTMERTLSLAKQADVRCGAHPSYPDRKGFGRREMKIALEDLRASLKTQVQTIKHHAEKQGVLLGHLKPHGSLYNNVAKDIDLARMVAGIANEESLILVGPPGSASETAALQIGTTFAGEGFVDRHYMPNGSLMPRSQEGAVLSDMAQRVAQGCQLAAGKALYLDTENTKGDKTRLSLTLTVKTLCIHSDSPGALETAIAVSQALAAKNISIHPFYENPAIS